MSTTLTFIAIFGWLRCVNTILSFYFEKNVMLVSIADWYIPMFVFKENQGFFVAIP